MKFACFFFQQLVNSGRCRVNKIKGTENEADLGTKILDKHVIEQHLRSLGYALCMPHEEASQDVVGHLAACGVHRRHAPLVPSVGVKLIAAITTMLAALPLGSSTFVPENHNVVLRVEAYTCTSLRTFIAAAFIPLAVGCLLHYLVHARVRRGIEDLSIIELWRELRKRGCCQWKCIEDYSTYELRSESFARGHLHPQMTKSTQSQCTYSSIRGVTHPRFEFLRRQQDGCWSD